MSTLDNNRAFIFGGFAKGAQRKALHPKVRQIFLDFENECREQGLELMFFSGTRDFEEQKRLREEYLAGRNNGIFASPPGYSFHNFSMAVDTLVWNGEKFVREKSLLSRVAKIGSKFGLRWGGNFSQKSEQHHFDYSFGFNVSKIRKKYNNGELDEEGYVVLENSEIQTLKSQKDELQFNTSIGTESFITNIEETEEKLTNKKNRITNVEEKEANGIWQIIKLVADRYSLGQSVNDATISFNQGSLINFIKKVIQSPWLQFYGDTYNDEYFFTARKEPFDLNGFLITPKHAGVGILEDDVLGDDLNWYNGPIYSWYQIIPQGSFLGEQNQIFAHVTSVFFEQYADVFGSKPFSVVSNYINFIKIGDGNVMLQKAVEDLRYLVESNMYLPFTRQGTITIKGNSSIKRGFWIYYNSTNEIFYIDAVSHRCMITDSGEEMVTTLKVSRGMDVRHAIPPKNKSTKSYFNLILFDNPPSETLKKTIKVDTEYFSFYFDNNRSYLIDLNENWPGADDTEGQKMFNQVLNFPNLRNELNSSNQRSIQNSVKLIEENPEGNFICFGYIDEDFGNKNDFLPIQRAQTLRNKIINEYMKKHPSMDRKVLESRIFATPSDVAVFDEEYKKQFQDPTPNQYKVKAYQRLAEFILVPYEKEIEFQKEVIGVNWKVNKEVFDYFLRRKQFNKC